MRRALRLPASRASRREIRSPCGPLARLAGLACAVAILSVTPATSAPGRGVPERAQATIARQQLLVLREAFQLVSTVGNAVWPGWARVPMTVVIIDDEDEFLLNAPDDWEAAGGFEPIDQTFLGRPIYRRNRTLPRALRAAFPVAGLPAAVVGSWQATEESPNEWAITLVHEWFHVMQMVRGESGKVEPLHLGESAYPSVQLDYPFAYGDEDIGHAIHLLGSSLYDFWNRSRTMPRAVQRKFLAETSWAALQNLETVISLKYGNAAYDYFRYQTWKEGVARYTQVQVSLLAANLEDNGGFRRQPGFAALTGAMSYGRLWEEVTHTNYWLIRTALGNEGGSPTSFYGIGHGLAELLDAVNPGWKERYFEEGIWLDDLFAEVMDPESLAAR